MAGTLPATGTAISMGRTGKAYFGGGTSIPTSIGNSALQKLNSAIGRGATVTTPLSATFGGRTTPYTY